MAEVPTCGSRSSDRSRARRDGAVLDLGGPKQRAVLAFLLTHRREPVSLDRMIDELWGEDAPPKATASLQAYVSNLRRLLEPDRAPRAPARILVSRPPGYALDIDRRRPRFSPLRAGGRRRPAGPGRR